MARLLDDGLAQRGKDATTISQIDGQQYEAQFHSKNQFVDLGIDSALLARINNKTKVEQLEGQDRE